MIFNENVRGIEFLINAGMQRVLIIGHYYSFRSIREAYGDITYKEGDNVTFGNNLRFSKAEMDNVIYLMWLLDVLIEFDIELMRNGWE